MLKIKLESYGFQDNFEYHHSIKDRLLMLINKSRNDFDGHPNDKIDYLDWRESANTNKIVTGKP